MAALRELELNSGMRCAKIMLLTVSFMFAITAVLLVMVGSTIQTIYYDLRQFVDDHFLSPATLLIAIGFILLFVSTLGAYGTIKESVMLINLYGVCLFLVFILEVSAAIAAFVMKGQVREMLQITMNQSMADYENNAFVQAGVDVMQSNLECCGVDGPKDWLKYIDRTNISMEHGILVPHSCCLIAIIGKDNTLEKCGYPYQSGCLARMDLIVSESIMLIAAGATTVAFVQILGSICAFMLAKTLRRHKSIREARRWQLQQNLDLLISGNKISPPMNSPTTGYVQLEGDPMSYTPGSPSVIN